MTARFGVLRQALVGLTISVVGHANSQSPPAANELFAKLGTPQSAGAAEGLRKIGTKVIPRAKSIALRGSIAARIDAIELLGEVGPPKKYRFFIDIVTDLDATCH